MPKTEEKFEDFLKRNGVHFESQRAIGNCPFVKRGKHKVDFIIENTEGEKLYVEVKGQLSFYSVNVLEYLLCYSAVPFYVFQMTNEDWIGALKQGHSALEKIKHNVRQQEHEILQFIECTLSAEQLTKRSLGRLKAYKKLRAGDVDRWCKIVDDKEKRK